MLNHVLKGLHSTMLSMLSLSTAAVLSGCNLFQAPPSEPRITSLTPSMGVAAQAVTGVTPGFLSVTVNFDTPMNPTDTERAVAIYPGDYNPASNPATFTTLGLTSMCNGRWRVRNPNAVPISFNWDVYNTTQKGVGVAPANSDVFFQTSLGSNTVRLFASGRQQQVKATNPAACSGNLFNFVWSGDSRSVTVTPATALTQDARYTMAVSTNAKSTAGVALAQPYAAGFVAQQQQLGNSVTATLAPGGTITGPDGVTITAPTNGFSDSVQLTIKRLGQTELAAIDALPSVKSNYYLITSEPDAYSSEDSFAIKIPVQQISPSEEYAGYVYGENNLHSRNKYWQRIFPTETEPSGHVRIFTNSFTKELGGFVYAVRSFPKTSSNSNLNLQSVSQGLQLTCDTTVTLTIVTPQQDVIYPCPRTLAQNLLQVVQSTIDQHSLDMSLTSYEK